MAIVSVKLLIHDNYSAFCLASESNKQNLQDRILDLYTFLLSLKAYNFSSIFRLHYFAAVFFSFTG